MNAAEIARQLHGRKSGVCWMARCPAHDDKNPSLSLWDVDGEVLVHCHAGCEQSAVVAALRAGGLWSAPPHSSSVIVATYDYCDETGQLLYQVVRTEPKGFFQRHPDSYGGWINRKGKRQVLYHLHDVVEAPIVFLTEGEKDAETLHSNGFAATTNAGGAKAPWLPQYTEALRGREVILIPDGDLAGRERVARIARALVGRVERLVILELEGAKDITEWFERGHSECELIEQIESGEVSR
jgi:5S rRNA maturation endonuclease (ribonuclease M5)